jgi:hypothetical protein
MRLRNRSLLTAGVVTACVAFATLAASPAANAAFGEDYGDVSCAVQYDVNGWETGQTATVTITNTGDDAAIEGWELSYTLPDGQQITPSPWNASVSGDEGYVTATNLEYNGTIEAGQSVNFGYNVSFGEDADSESVPSEFELNGVACSVGDQGDQGDQGGDDGDGGFDW